MVIHRVHEIDVYIHIYDTYYTFETFNKKSFRDLQDVRVQVDGILGRDSDTYKIRMGQVKLRAC